MCKAWKRCTGQDCMATSWNVCYHWRKSDNGYDAISLRYLENIPPSVALQKMRSEFSLLLLITHKTERRCHQNITLKIYSIGVSRATAEALLIIYARTQRRGVRTAPVLQHETSAAPTSPYAGGIYLKGLPCSLQKPFC